MSDPAYERSQDHSANWVDPPGIAADDDGTSPRVEPDGRCPACSHARDLHDRISTRFCAATITAGSDRGCVCVGDGGT